jgi:hypothetical protein
MTGEAESWQRKVDQRTKPAAYARRPQSSRRALTRALVVGYGSLKLTVMSVCISTGWLLR